jgi:hypothetical protein
MSVRVINSPEVLAIPQANLECPKHIILVVNRHLATIHLAHPGWLLAPVHKEVWPSLKVFKQRVRA